MRTYKAEFALMIGGTQEALKSYINKLLEDDKIYIAMDFFYNFELIQVCQDLWIFAFCHHSHEYDRITWSNMRDVAEFIDLVVYEQIFEYAREEALAERVDDFEDTSCLDIDLDKPLGKDQQLKMMECLITSRLVFDHKLKVVFEA